MNSRRPVNSTVMSLFSQNSNPWFQLKAAGKYLLSLTKTHWQLTDYPIRFRHFDVGEPAGRLKPFPWSAQIINWWHVGGFGNTKQEALADLQKRFAEIKILPRPGTGLPIELASRQRIGSFDDIADDFFRRILDLNYRECFVSDESSLWDFHDHESNEHLHHNIWDSYRVNVSDIDDGNLVKIFERIENRH